MGNFRGKFYVKMIAAVVALVFLHQQIVWAQGGAAPAAVPAAVRTSANVAIDRESADVCDIDLPYNLAHRDEVYTGVSEEKIIHLQDAHASLSAQYSLVNLLDVLAADYDLEFIALEGTEGVIDTSLLKSFPDKEIREKTADLLMREGRMSAGEFFQITRDKDDMILCGVEDNALYKENLKEFCSVIGQREPLIKMVKAFRGQIDALEEKVYSEELRAFIYKGRAHKNGSLSFSDYWRDIRPFLDRFSIETDALRDMPLLIKSIELETKINFEKANTERTDLISVLTGRLGKDELEALVLESVNFKEQKVSPANFHKYLKKLTEKNSISMSPYKNFSMFTQYISLYESVDIFNLYNEVEFVEKTIRDKLYKTDDERELNEISVMTELLRGLYSIELSSRDFGFFEAYREKYDAKKFAEFLRDKCGEYNVSIGKGYDLAEMLAGITSAANFYETAARRDRLMIQNTLKRMKSEKKRVAALITGGYHTKGLTKIMKENKLSYLIISPKFEKDEERPYVAVLTGKKKPYQELLESGKYQIMAAAFNDPLDGIDARLLKDQEIALLTGGIAGLYGSGNWKKIIKEWKLDINPDEDIQEVLKLLVVRRIKDTVLAGLGNVPIVALKKDKDGNPKRISISKKHRKIWEKRTGTNIPDLKDIGSKVTLETELDTVASDDFENKSIQFSSKRDNPSTTKHDKKILLEDMKEVLEFMDVSKEYLEGEKGEKYIKQIMDMMAGKSPGNQSAARKPPVAKVNLSEKQKNEAIDVAPVLDEPFVLTREKVEEICQRLIDEADSKPYGQNEKKLRKNVERAFLKVGVPKTFLESDVGKKQIQRAMDVLKKDDENNQLDEANPMFVKPAPEDEESWNEINETIKGFQEEYNAIYAKTPKPSIFEQPELERPEVGLVREVKKEEKFAIVDNSLVDLFKKLKDMEADKDTSVFKTPEAVIKDPVSDEDTREPSKVKTKVIKFETVKLTESKIVNDQKPGARAYLKSAEDVIDSPTDTYEDPIGSKDTKKSFMKKIEAQFERMAYAPTIFTAILLIMLGITHNRAKKEEKYKPMVVEKKEVEEKSVDEIVEMPAKKYSMLRSIPGMIVKAVKSICNSIKSHPNVFIMTFAGVLWSTIAEATTKTGAPAVTFFGLPLEYAIPLGAAIIAAITTVVVGRRSARSAGSAQNVQEEKKETPLDNSKSGRIKLNQKGEVKLDAFIGVVFLSLTLIYAYVLRSIGYGVLVGVLFSGLYWVLTNEGEESTTEKSSPEDVATEEDNGSGMSLGVATIISAVINSIMVFVGVYHREIIKIGNNIVDHNLFGMSGCITYIIGFAALGVGIVVTIAITPDVVDGWWAKAFGTTENSTLIGRTLIGAFGSSIMILMGLYYKRVLEVGKNFLGPNFPYGTTGIFLAAFSIAALVVGMMWTIVTVQEVIGEWWKKLSNRKAEAKKTEKGQDRENFSGIMFLTLVMFLFFMFVYRTPLVHSLDADTVKKETSQSQKVPRKTIELDPSKLKISGNRLFMEWTGDLTGGYAFEVEFEKGFEGPRVQMGIDGGQDLGYVYSYPKVPTREGLLRFDLASGNDRQNGGECYPAHFRNVGFAIWDDSSPQKVKNKIKSIRFVPSDGYHLSRNNNGQTIETSHRSVSNIEWEQKNSSWTISLDVNERETKEVARFGSVYINFNAAEYAKNNPGKPIKVGLYLTEKFTGTQGGGGNGIWVGFVRRDENNEYKKIYEIEGQGGYTGKVYANKWTEYSFNLPEQELENVFIRVNVDCFNRQINDKAFSVRVGSASKQNISTSEKNTGKKDLEKTEPEEKKLEIWKWIKTLLPSKSKRFTWATIIVLTSFIAGSGVFNAALSAAGATRAIIMMEMPVTIVGEWAWGMPVGLILIMVWAIVAGVALIKLIRGASKSEERANYLALNLWISATTSIAIVGIFSIHKIIIGFLKQLALQSTMGVAAGISVVVSFIVLLSLTYVSTSASAKIIGEKLFKKKEHYDLARSALWAVLVTNGALILRHDWDFAMATVKESLMYEYIGSWAFVGMKTGMAIVIIGALLSIGGTIWRLWKLSRGKKYGNFVRLAIKGGISAAISATLLYNLFLIKKGLNSSAFHLLASQLSLTMVCVGIAVLCVCTIYYAVRFVYELKEAGKLFASSEKTGEKLVTKEQDPNDGKTSPGKRWVKRLKRLGVFIFIKKHSKLFPLMLVTAISFFAGLGVFNATIAGATKTVGRINIFSAAKNVDLNVTVQAIPKEVLIGAFIEIVVGLVAMCLVSSGVHAIRLTHAQKRGDITKEKIKDVKKKQREMNRQAISSVAWVVGSFLAVYNLAWIIGFATVVIPFCVLCLNIYAGYSVLKSGYKFVQSVKGSSLPQKMETKAPKKHNKKKKRSGTTLFTVIMFMISVMLCWVPGVVADDDKPESIPAVKFTEPRTPGNYVEPRVPGIYIEPRTPGNPYVGPKTFPAAPDSVTPRTDVGTGEEIVPLTGWRAETYYDSQGIVDVYGYNGILKIVADMKGQDDNTSMGEVYRYFDEVKDFTGKKESFKIRAPEKYALNQENGVTPFMEDVNGNKQYADRTKITRAGEWIIVEMVPLPYGRARMKENEENKGKGKWTDPGFDPSMIMGVGIKFVIDEKSSDTFISKNPDGTIKDGVLEVADIRIMPVEGVVHEAEWQNVYRDVPIVVPAIDAQTFVENSGVSFYLKMYERAIGTPDGVTAHYEETLNEFRKLAEHGVKTARILLCMGSKDTSGIEFDENNDMPIGFKDQDLAILDIANLIRIGAETDIEFTLALHNKDITEAHPGVFGDEEKRAALVALDKIALNGAKEILEENVWKYFEYGEMLNEPDEAGVHSHYTQEFVKTGNKMIRDDIGKPVSLGPDKIEHIGNWLPMLEAGDMYQIHVYNDNLEELLAELRRNIGEFVWPEGVKICFGEAQVSMYDTESRTTNSILYEVFLAAHESGADGVYGWLDNRFAPRYTLDKEEYQNVTQYMMSVEYNDRNPVYYEGTEFLKSETLSETDENGNVCKVYVEYRNENFKNTGRGRIFMVIRETATADNELAFRFEYYEYPSDAQPQYKYGYSDAELTDLVTEYKYEEYGPLQKKINYEKGERYTYYPSEEVQNVTFDTPDEEGNVFYAYFPDGKMRVSKRQVPNDKGEIAFKYTYYDAPDDNILKTITAYFDAEMQNPAAEYEYDIDDNLVVDDTDDTDEHGSTLDTSDSGCFIGAVNTKRVNTPIVEVFKHEGIEDTVFEKIKNWMKGITRHLNFVIMTTFGGVLWLLGSAYAGAPSDFGEISLVEQLFATTTFGKAEFALVFLSVIAAGVITILALCRINTIEDVAFQEKPAVKKIRATNIMLLCVNIGMGIMQAVRDGGLTVGVSLFALSTLLLVVSFLMLKEKFVDGSVASKWVPTRRYPAYSWEKPVKIKTPIKVQFWKVFEGAKEWIRSVMKHLGVFITTLFIGTLSAVIASAKSGETATEIWTLAEIIKGFLGTIGFLAVFCILFIVVKIIYARYDDRQKETEFKIALGMPEKMYNDILKNNLESSLEGITNGIEIIRLEESSDREVMQKEFNEKTKGKKVIGAIIDPSTLEVISGVDEDNNFEYRDFDKFVNVIEDFIKTAKKEIAPLMAPEPGFFKLKGLTRGEIKKDFDKLNKLTKEKTKEWDGKIKVLVRTLPMESLELVDKGAYHVPVNKWHRAVVGENRVSKDAKLFAKGSGGLAFGSNRKYISVSAYNLADMRFIANAIKDLGIDKDKASQFIHVRLRNNNVQTREALQKYMKKTGLDGYLHPKNVDIISEQEEKDMTLDKILQKVKYTFSGDMVIIEHDQIFVGSTKELNFSDVDKAILSDEKAPKFVQMKGEGIVSQLLLTLVEFSAAGKIPASLGKISLAPNDTGLKIYIYIPKIKKADYNAILDVIKNYEKMMTSV